MPRVAAPVQAAQAQAALIGQDHLDLAGSENGLGEAGADHEVSAHRQVVDGANRTAEFCTSTQKKGRAIGVPFSHSFDLDQGRH